MKFKLLSDIHLEFYHRTRYMIKNAPVWEPTETDQDKDTVLLLAGDIHLGKRALPWIEKMQDRFYDVAYILGNHEFYHHEWYEVKNFWAKQNNITFLDNDVTYYDDVRLIGGTLWTQVTDPHARWYGPKNMTDYQIIMIREHGKFREINVADTDKAHFETANYIREQLQKPWDGKTIVMTHHLPHPICVKEKWNNSILNPFFMTDLEHIIENFDIDVWCHGHTHDNVDEMVHDTRILCNPMGYHGVNLNQDFNEGLIFEL